MDSAKAAVKDFMSKSGHHDTTVHEKVAPAVTHETHKSQRHEEITTAIDKEIHQDHYHTSIQPVVDKEILPEQHHHNLAAVEHRSFEHGNDRAVAERLKAEQAQFRDERIEGETRVTSSVNPTIGGEHIHHHVHETIQPVINKETIESHVIHTTVPIHEVHHNAAQHHTASALPAVSMADFKKQGGVLTGREERYDGFEGEPRSVGGSHAGTSLAGAAAATTTTTGLTGTHAHSGHHHGHSGVTGSTTTGTTGTTGLAKTSTTGSGVSGRDTVGSSTTDRHVDSKATKPSLLDKLNPMKDTDHDGKKGFMD